MSLLEKMAQKKLEELNMSIVGDEIMTFADTLKKAPDPEEEKRRIVQKIEENPRLFSEFILDIVEPLIENKARGAANRGDNKFSGYLYEQYDQLHDNFYYGIGEIGDAELIEKSDNIDQEILSVCHNPILIDMVYPQKGTLYKDKLVLGYKDVCTGKIQNVVSRNLFSSYPSRESTRLSQNVVDSVCLAVCNKLDKLGFKHYSVVPKKQQFFMRGKKKVFFGLGVKTTLIPVDTATVLWLEVSW